MTSDAMPTNDVTPETPARPWSRPYWFTEQGVYGVILVSGMILVADEYENSSWDTFFQVLLTVLVFWAAHLFAGVLGHPRMLAPGPGEILSVLKDSASHARGLLSSAILPCFVLLLGSLNIIADRDAVTLALWSGVLVLTVIGLVIFWRHGYGWFGRIVGALATGAFGAALIVVKALIH